MTFQPENKTVFTKALQRNEKEGSGATLPHLSGGGGKCEVWNFFFPPCGAGYLPLRCIYSVNPWAESRPTVTPEQLLCSSFLSLMQGLILFMYQAQGKTLFKLGL